MFDTVYFLFCVLAVKITLTGANDSELVDCQNKIKELARSCSLKLHLTDQTDMADWPQSTVQKYYEYCLQRRVIPTLDIQNSILDLMGPKDAVSYSLTWFQMRSQSFCVLSGEIIGK
jgi:hypothetical protein